MLKNEDYHFSQEQITLCNSCWKWNFWCRLSLFPHVLVTVVPRLWRHTGLPCSVSCSGRAVIHDHFIMNGHSFVVSGQWHHACHCSTWMSRIVDVIHQVGFRLMPDLPSGFLQRCSELLLRQCQQTHSS